MYYGKNKRYFRTYADLERLFKTCRSPVKGKPLSSWCKIHKDGNDFYLSFNGFRFTDRPAGRRGSDGDSGRRAV